MPVLLACVLQCDAPICINNRTDQTGYIDPAGGILYKKGGLVWRRSGDHLACSDDCERQLSQPKPGGGTAPGNGDTP